MDLGLKRKDALFLAFCALLGAAVSLVIYSNPIKYYALGTLFVQKPLEEGNGYFKYEGFYASQTAQNFTNSAIAVLESTNVKSTALESVGVIPTEREIKSLSKRLTVKKTGPQVINIKIRADSPDTARNLWVAINLAFQNSMGSKEIYVLPIAGSPVIFQEYRQLWLYMFLGTGAGIISGLAVVFFKNSKKEIKFL